MGEERGGRGNGGQNLIYVRRIKKRILDFLKIIEDYNCDSLNMNGLHRLIYLDA